MSKIYISGRISGLNIETAKRSFEYAVHELMLSKAYHINDIVNPFDIRPFLGLNNWWCYMFSDIMALRKCEAIFMLKGWQNSRGACIEHLIAVWCKKIVIYQEVELNKR